MYTYIYIHYIYIYVILYHSQAMMVYGTVLPQLHQGSHHWALPTRFQGKLQAFQGRKCRLTRGAPRAQGSRGDSASEMERKCLEMVGGWATPLKNICQLGLLFPIYGNYYSHNAKIKHVPNHQLVTNFAIGSEDWTWLNHIKPNLPGFNHENMVIET